MGLEKVYHYHFPLFLPNNPNLAQHPLGHHAGAPGSFCQDDVSSSPAHPAPEPLRRDALGLEDELAWGICSCPCMARWM